MSTRIDHGENVALRKVGNPEAYTVCGWEALDDGSVMYRMKRELPRDAGERRQWAGPEKTACVTVAEMDAEMLRHETETGRCAKCDGSAQEWAGWSAAGGNRFAPCRRCGATGKPANAAGQGRREATYHAPACSGNDGRRTTWQASRSR